MEDHQIIDFLREGKHSIALEALYECFPKIERLILSKGGSEDEAKDIFQEALIVFYKKAQQPDFVLTAKISTYLYSVCRFLWKDELQKQNRKVQWDTDTHQEIESTDDIEYHLQKEKQFEAVNQALKQLGKRCVQLLDMFYQKKYSMKKIAVALQFSNERSAKAQKYKCMEQAKKLAHQEFSYTANA